MTDHKITQRLIAATEGDEQAARQFWAMVYDELHRIARRQLAGERRGHTLCTTGLVHETFLRLIDQTSISWQNRAHFYGVAARVMRHILVDYARKHRAQKRGGGQARVTFEEMAIPVYTQVEELLALDEALSKLSQLDERLTRVVEYRYFGGLTEEETAEMIGVNVRTVQRYWRKAKAWLYVEMYGSARHAPTS